MRVIAIDGPAGAGKSTIARALAARLKLQYLDTGAMYRAVTCAALQRNISVEDRDLVAELARELTVDVQRDRVLVDGVDVTAAIRTPQITAAVSAVPVRVAPRGLSAVAPVRQTAQHSVRVRSQLLDRLVTRP